MHVCIYHVYVHVHVSIVHVHVHVHVYGDKISLVRSLSLDPRFERLQLKCLAGPIHTKYTEVLGKFSTQIDRIQKVFSSILHVCILHVH